MKLFWTGTDSLMLVNYSMRKWNKKPYWFVFRILIKALDFFIEGHYCVSENVADNVRKFGTRKQVKVFRNKLKYPMKFGKIPHDGFNVIYYNPKNRPDKKFTIWLYGIDIIEQVKKLLPNINWIELDGTKDMSKVYPIADFCLRPNRHDGASRMIQECKINEIPCYHTHSDIANISDIIKQIINEFNNKQRSDL